MKNSETKHPTQKELEKELNEYLSKKYGDKVKLMVSSPFPQPSFESKEKEEKKEEKKKIGKIQFDLKPEELEAYLDMYIVKQEKAKEVLATKICTHYHRAKEYLNPEKKRKNEEVGGIKNNIILIGPTGVGKTYMIKLIAQKIGVPFVKGDATKFSETGYVGGDVEDLIRDLVHEAGGDIELAQFGIIYIDEIDKIASSGNLLGPDVSRSGVQRALLKPMEETLVDLKVPHDPISQIEAIEEYRRTGKRTKKTINTRNILFVVSGAFNGLEDIIKNRVKEKNVGFGATISSEENKLNYLKMVKAEDLIQYGFESEFVGRLPIIAVLENLTEEDLYMILKNPNNPIIKGKRKDFFAYGIDIQFTDGALKKIASIAAQEATGARGLVSAVEKVTLKFEKKLPSTNIKKVLITEKVVKDPDKALEELLKDPENSELVTRFDEEREKELIRIKKELIHKKDDIERKLGIILTNRAFDFVVKKGIKEVIDPHLLFDEISNLYKKVKLFEKEFLKRTGIEIIFEQSAIDALLSLVFEKDEKINEFLAKWASTYELGLRLIRDKKGKSSFTITEEAINNPEETLNIMIKDSYR